MRGMTGKPYEEEPKASSLDAIQARRQALASKVGEVASDDTNTLASRLRRLQVISSLPDCSFIERRQAQLDTENLPPEAA